MTTQYAAIQQISRIFGAIDRTRRKRFATTSVTRVAGKRWRQYRFCDCLLWYSRWPNLQRWWFLN